MSNETWTRRIVRELTDLMELWQSNKLVFVFVLLVVMAYVGFNYRQQILDLIPKKDTPPTVPHLNASPAPPMVSSANLAFAYYKPSLRFVDGGMRGELTFINKEQLLHDVKVQVVKGIDGSGKGVALDNMKYDRVLPNSTIGDGKMSFPLSDSSILLQIGIESDYGITIQNVRFIRDVDDGWKSESEYFFKSDFKTIAFGEYHMYDKDNNLVAHNINMDIDKRKVIR